MVFDDISENHNIMLHVLLYQNRFKEKFFSVIAGIPLNAGALEWGSTLFKNIHQPDNLKSYL